MFKTFDHFNISSIEQKTKDHLLSQANKDSVTTVTCYDGPPSVSGLIRSYNGGEKTDGVGIWRYI